MSSGTAKLLFLLMGCLVYLSSDTLATSDEVVNLKPIDLSQLILQKKNYIEPRADENSTTTATPTTTQTPSFAACGVANGNGKIYGGNETETNEFPWQADLKVDWIGIGNTTANVSSYCGGSLIGDRWILTSASCLVAPSQKHELIRVNVYLGGHNISAASEINRKEFWSSQTFIHPDWNSTTQSGNVALVNLSTVVEYSKFIRPICLANTSEPDYVKQIVTLIGVGLTQPSDNSSSSLILNKMTTSVVSNSQCNSTYKNLMTDRMMCTAGVANNSGICDVDKGDPLMFKQPDGIFKQIGIVSLTPTGCQKAGTPVAYTRLSSYSSWITNMTMTPSTPPSTPPPSTTPSPTTPCSATINGMSFLLELVTFVLFAIMALY